MIKYTEFKCITIYYSHCIMPINKDKTNIILKNLKTQFFSVQIHNSRIFTHKVLISNSTNRKNNTHLQDYTTVYNKNNTAV